MGVFNYFRDAIHEAKQKAHIETMRVSEKIEHVSFYSACRIINDEMKAGSIPMQLSLNKLFIKRLNDEDNTEELFYAFTDMYRYGQRKDGFHALNIANRIGKKLYLEINDPRVEANEEETVFKPKRY